MELSLSMLGGKWKTIILARLKQDPMRYGDLRRAVPDLADKVLTQRLVELKEAGFVDRVQTEDGQARYALTDRGRSLQPVLEALYAWGEETAIDTGASFRTPIVVPKEPQRLRRVR